MQLPCIVPDWPAPPGVRAICTTRGTTEADGQSCGPWRYFNLGESVGDDPHAVAANRAHLRQALGARPVFLRQVHGVGAITLGADTADGAIADAALTGERHLACTVLVADCLPILLTDTDGSRVAALHAGWRGLAAGVIERTLEHWRALETNAGEAPGFMAWLGPCIGPQAFEVGPEVRAAFMAVDVRAEACFRPLEGGKYLADLPQLARQRLASQGVVRIHGNDGSRQWCTVTGAARFFSHRRSQRSEEATGRMAACIWRE